MRRYCASSITPASRMSAARNSRYMRHLSMRLAIAIASLRLPKHPHVLVIHPKPCVRPVSHAGALDPHPLHERSEEHTSELQSRENPVCRLLLEKKRTI